MTPNSIAILKILAKELLHNGWLMQEADRWVKTKKRKSFHAIEKRSKFAKCYLGDGKWNKTFKTKLTYLILDYLYESTPSEGAEIPL